MVLCLKENAWLTVGGKCDRHHVKVTETLGKSDRNTCVKVTDA